MGKLKAHTKRKPQVRLDDSKSKLNANIKKEKRNSKAQQEQSSDYFDHRTGAVYSTRPEDTDVKLVEAKITNFLKQLGELSHPDQELEEYTAAPQGYLPTNHPKHNSDSSPGITDQVGTAGSMEAAVATVTTASDTPVTFWQEVRDPKTNRTYYWNPRTSDVTWTLPDNAVITSEAAETKMPEDPELEEEQQQQQQNALQNSLSEAYVSYAKAYCGVDPADGQPNQQQQDANGTVNQLPPGESGRGLSEEKNSTQKKAKARKLPLVEGAASPQEGAAKSKKLPALPASGTPKVGKAEPQMLRLQVSSASDELSRKLNFLHVLDDGLTQVQKLGIILETRLTDWKEGVLSSKYMLAKLKEMSDTLQEYIESAMPTGWVCLWDSATCRYYYKNQVTGDISWGYPSQSVGSPASSHGETDPCSMEEGTKESNRDQEAIEEAAMQEVESSVDSGVDEKLDKQLLASQAPPPPPLPTVTSDSTAVSADLAAEGLQDNNSMSAPVDESSTAPQPPAATVQSIFTVRESQQPTAVDQNDFPGQDVIRPAESSAYLSPPDSTEVTPDKSHKKVEGQEAVEQPKEDLYAFLPPAAYSAEKEAELPQVQPQSIELIAQESTAKLVPYPAMVPSPAEMIEGASCETSGVSREDIGMSNDNEEARLRQKLIRRLNKPSAVGTGEAQAETVEDASADKAGPVCSSADADGGEDNTEKSMLSQETPDADAQARPDVRAEEPERSKEETSVARESATASIEEQKLKASPEKEEVTPPRSKEKESKESARSKKRSRDYSDQSDSDDTSRHRKSYSKKSRHRYDSDRSDYSPDDSHRRRSSRRHRSRSRSYDYYSDEDRHRSSRRYRSGSSDDDDGYHRRDSRRSSRRYDRYSDDYSDDDDRRSSRRSSRKRRSRSRSGDRKDSKSRKEKKKKKEKKKHRHDDDDRSRSSDKHHSKSSSSSRFKDKKPRDSPKPLPPPPEKTFVPAKFKPKGKMRDEPEEPPPAFQQQQQHQPAAMSSSQEVLTPQQMEMMKNIASATGMAPYGYPPVLEMATDASTATYVAPTQPVMVEPVPSDQQPAVTAVEPVTEVPVAGETFKPPAQQAPITVEEQTAPTVVTAATGGPDIVEMQEPEEVEMEIEQDTSPVKEPVTGENQSVLANDSSKALEAYKASVIESLSGAQQVVGGGGTESSQKEVQMVEEKLEGAGVKKPQEIKSEEVVPGNAAATKEEQQETGKTSPGSEPLPPGTLAAASAKPASSTSPPGLSGEEMTGGPQQEDYKMPSDDEATPPASVSAATTPVTVVTTGSNDKPMDSPVTSSVTSVTSTELVSTSTGPSPAMASSSAVPSSSPAAATSVVTTTTADARDSTPPLAAVAAPTTSSVAPTSVAGYSYSAPATSYGASYSYQNDPAQQQQQAYAAAYAQSMYNPAAMGGTYYPYQYGSGTYDHNQYAAAMNYYANAYQAAYNASAYQAYYQQQGGAPNGNNQKK